MLATQFDAARESQRDVQSAVQPRERVQQRTARSARSTWDRISLFGCVAICTIAGWVMAATAAHVAGVNQQVDQLRTAVQQTSAVNGSLTARLDTLTQPALILEEAQKWGMTPAHTINIPAVATNGAN